MPNTTAVPDLPALSAKDAVHLLRLALVQAEYAIKGREHTGFINRALVATEHIFGQPATQPAPSGDAVEVLREAFEAAYGPKDSFAWRNADDTYKVQSLQMAWEIWLRRAALPPPIVEPVKMTPSGYAYRYPDGYIRFTNGEEINGSRPAEAVPYYFGSAPTTTPASAPSDGAADARDAALEEAAALCDEALRKANEEWADSYSYGQSGYTAEKLAEDIRALKSIVSTHTTTGGENE